MAWRSVYEYLETLEMRKAWYWIHHVLIWTLGYLLS
jgi:hypothetical protein